MDRMLHIADSNAQRLLHLINYMLDLEMIESGKMDLKMKHVDVSILAEDEVRENMFYAGKHNVRFELKSAPADTMVWGAPEAPMQVLANLLSNAAKFSPAQIRFL